MSFTDFFRSKEEIAAREKFLGKRCKIKHDDTSPTLYVYLIRETGCGIQAKCEYWNSNEKKPERITVTPYMLELI